MNIKTMRKKLVIVIGIWAAILSGTTIACAAMNARKPITDPREISQPKPMAALQTQAGDVVAEWNAEAVRLTLLTSSGLAPVQQTRTMAIVQVSVHDAVNGITGKYKTYLSPGAAPAGASPEAAAIAAAHHALRNLFLATAHVTALDAMFLASLAAHGLSVDDPGVGYGQSAAAAILAARAGDGSAVAQYPYTAPGSGQPGVWIRLTALDALLAGWGDVVP